MTMKQRNNQKQKGKRPRTLEKTLNNKKGLAQN